MLFLLVALAACTSGSPKIDDTSDTGETGDTAPVSACDCVDPATLAFTPTFVSGFDDWSGNAVVWAVDPAAGRVLVVALAYDLGVPTIEFAPECDDPDALVGSWVADVPPSAVADVGVYPLLGAAVTTAGGVRSLPQDIGALLLEGDIESTTPSKVYVATGGGVTLTRNDKPGDRLLGALTFAATADAVGGHATADCDEAVRIAGMDLSFSSTGGE